MISKYITHILCLVAGVLFVFSHVSAQASISGVFLNGNEVVEYTFVSGSNSLVMKYKSGETVASSDPLTLNTTFGYLTVTFDPKEIEVIHNYSQDMVAEISSGYIDAGRQITQIEFTNGQADISYSDGTTGSISGVLSYFSNSNSGIMRVDTTNRSIAFSAPEISVVEALPNITEGGISNNITNGGVGNNTTSDGSGNNTTSGGASNNTTSGGAGNNTTSGGNEGADEFPPSTNNTSGDELPPSTQPQQPTGISNPLKVDSFTDLITLLFDKIIMPIGTSIVVLFIIYSGFLFVTAQGNEEKLKTAKQTFTWTVVGAAVLLGASVIANIVENTIKQLNV